MKTSPITTERLLEDRSLVYLWDIADALLCWVQYNKKDFFTGLMLLYDCTWNRTLLMVLLR